MGEEDEEEKDKTTAPKMSEKIELFHLGYSNQVNNLLGYAE